MRDEILPVAGTTCGRVLFSSASRCTLYRSVCGSTSGSVPKALYTMPERVSLLCLALHIFCYLRQRGGGYVIVLSVIL